MLAIRLRVSPCRARCSPRSEGRVTTIVPSSRSTLMSRATRSWSSPLGPFTRTSSGSIVISTPSGTVMGCLPMRLTGASLPDPRDQLAADAGAARVVTGHDTTGGGHDRRPHPALHLRDAPGVDVAAPARLGQALHAGDNGPPVLGVLELHAQRAAHPRGLDVVGLDVALLGEDARELRLEGGGRHLHG